MKDFLRFIFAVCFFISCFDGSVAQASNLVYKEASHMIGFTSNNISIGTLWLKVKFQCYENLVEVVKADGGFTQTTEDPQYIFSNHRVITEHSPGFSFARVNAFLSIETTGTSKIGVAESDRIVDSYARVNEIRAAQGLPAIECSRTYSGKKEFRISLVWSGRHEVVKEISC